MKYRYGKYFCITIVSMADVDATATGCYCQSFQLMNTRTQPKTNRSHYTKKKNNNKNVSIEFIYRPYEVVDTSFARRSLHCVSQFISAQETQHLERKPGQS